MDGKISLVPFDVEDGDRVKLFLRERGNKMCRQMAILSDIGRNLHKRTQQAKYSHPQASADFSSPTGKRA
jgi:hypothetical protein